MSKSDKVSRTLQRRRMRAGRLLLRGMAQAQVARQVGVSRTTVSGWNELLEAGGLEALKRRPRGRPSGLDGQQKGEFGAAAQRRSARARLCHGAVDVATGRPADRGEIGASIQ